MTKQGLMLNFNYKLTTYTDYLGQLAALFNTTISNNELRLPEASGSGFFRVLPTDDGLPEALLYNFSLNDTLVLNRERDNAEFYTLVFDELNDGQGFALKIDRDEASDTVERSAAMYLTSFLYDVETVVYQNTNIKGIRILLSAAWMQHYLQLAENEEVLERYLALKSAGIWYKPVNDELLTLLHDLLTTEDTPRLFYQNKIFRIIELFFEWLYNEINVLPDTAGIARRDIEMAQKIEARLTEDVTRLPPTIRELAREAAMSESKLKKIFKTVYGLPPYEYYQKQRMQKARLMLLSGNYSVKDIGYTLGYANLSNFTLAFKKVFGKLPSQLLPK
jgi:AraC-like DNA-binding protein